MPESSTYAVSVRRGSLRWDPMLRAHYQQLRARGKLGKVALVACMRKLLTIVNARRRDELESAGGTAIAA